MTWNAVQMALQVGRHGLPGGTTLARLLAEHRGVRNHMDLPRLTSQRILAWADAHRERTGNWPTSRSGPIVDAPGETWEGVQAALSLGARGLPGGSSLARLLHAKRGARNKARLPPLTPSRIIRWARAHRDRTGRWPGTNSGRIPGSGGETWNGVDQALRRGLRGLVPGSSLARLLGEEGLKGNPRSRLPLTISRILRWADIHREETGQWPRIASGRVHHTRGERWDSIDNALRQGFRGLPGGSSLPQLLAERRGARHARRPPRLTPETILAWADAHQSRTGAWPTATSGRIRTAPGETWKAVNAALREGGRGLAGGSSLAQLLAEHRGVPNRADLPPFSVEQILAWADAYHARTGGWPDYLSGPIPEAPGENWSKVHAALYLGLRGLAGGSSLARLLRRRKQNPRNTGQTSL